VVGLLRRALAAALAALALSPAARAAEPIMPLSEVRAGMRCTALTVVRGTAISRFDAEVLDVVGTQSGLDGPRILVRVSGPVVDESGIGFGFSGSPILCPDASGTLRNAGAIAEGLGDYGNRVVLVRPIEAMLHGGTAAAPSTSRRRSRLAARAVPLTGALTVAGLSRSTRGVLLQAARRSGRPVLAAPAGAGPLGGFPRQELVPGAAVAALYAGGDVAAGAVGTVTYRDGDRVLAFGHALDALGRRSLFLEDAYVFGVISNPLTIPEAGLGSYKFTSAGGHPQGSIDSDTLAAVAGSVGASPPGIPLRAIARARSGGGSVSLLSRLADERPLGLGAGMSLVAPLAGWEALVRLLGDVGPVTLTMCFRVKLAGRRSPLGFCNRYFDGFRTMDDLERAGRLVDGFDLPPPQVERVTISMRARRGVTTDVLLSARAPRRVRPGQRIRVRLVVARRGDGRRRLSFPLRVPRGLRPGEHTLVLAGTGGSGTEEQLLLAFEEALDIETPAAGPTTLRELSGDLAAIHRDQGIQARFRRGPKLLALRSGDVRYEGRLELSLNLRRARR
jgi:hypothetical protein